MGRLNNTAKTAIGPFRSKRAAMLRKRSRRSASRPFKAAVAVFLVGATLVSFAGVQGATEGVAGAATSTTIVSGLQGGFGLAVDASGNRYVTETNTNTVSKISPSGTKTTIGSGWNWPVGVAVNSAGDVFVAGGNDRVVKVSADGTMTTIGVFNGPGALTLDAAGNLFVANMTDVVEFPAVPDSGISADGNTGWKVVESGAIYGADGVAVAPDGTVYVSNYYYQRIDVLTPDGSGGYTRSEEGTSLGNWYPTGMSTDAAGNLYVTSPAKNAVYRFAPDGTYVSIVSGFQSYGVVVDAAGGSMYLTDGGLNGADYNSDRIIRVTGLLTPTTPTISNLPSSAVYGGSFTPTVSTTGDGSKSVTSSTTAVCSVNGSTGLVTYGGVGTCTLVAHVAAGTDYAAADGSPQGFNASQATPTTPSISNPPSSAVYGGSFTPTVSTTGDGSKSVTSSTTAVCTVNGSTGLVTYGGVGTCTLVAHVAAGTNYAAADGSTQGFNVSQATSSTVITCFGPMTYSGSPLTPCAVAVTGAGGLNTTTTVTFNHNINAGTATADASYTGDANHTGSVATQATFTINPATPTTPVITGAPAGAPVGSSFPLVVSTDSDGTHVVTSSTSTICRVDTSDVVHYLATGTCTLTASTLASSNYLASHGSPQSFVVQITPSLHWTKPKPFTYGTPLSPLQLDAGASVLGLFVYSSPAGTVLSAGSHTMTATFYPWDSTNYASVSISTTMIVKVARSTTTLTMSASSIAFSAEAAETFTVSSYTSTGVPNSGPVNVMAGKVLQCVAVLDSTGTGTCSLNDTELRPGRYPIKATTMGNSNVKGSLSASQLLTVTG